MGMSMGWAGGSGATLGNTSVSTPSSMVPRMPDTSIPSPILKDSSNFSSVCDGVGGDAVNSSAAPAASGAPEGAVSVSSAPEGDVGWTGLFLVAVIVRVLVPESWEICASTVSYTHLTLPTKRIV